MLHTHYTINTHTVHSYSITDYTLPVQCYTHCTTPKATTPATYLLEPSLARGTPCWVVFPLLFPSFSFFLYNTKNASPFSTPAEQKDTHHRRTDFKPPHKFETPLQSNHTVQGIKMTNSGFFRQIIVTQLLSPPLHTHVLAPLHTPHPRVMTSNQYISLSLFQ
jgi:hypothetical protein